MRYNSNKKDLTGNSSLNSTIAHFINQQKIITLANIRITEI